MEPKKVRECLLLSNWLPGWFGTWWGWTRTTEHLLQNSGLYILANWVFLHPGTESVAQTGLKLTVILLLQSCGARIKSLGHHSWQPTKFEKDWFTRSIFQQEPLMPYFVYFSIHPYNKSPNIRWLLILQEGINAFSWRWNSPSI